MTCGSLSLLRKVTETCEESATECVDDNSSIKHRNAMAVNSSQTNASSLREGQKTQGNNDNSFVSSRKAIQFFSIN